MTPLNILIIGNGVSGATLASLLLLSPGPASSKPHITILERAHKPRIEGQNVDIRGAGVKIIRKLGVEAAIRSATTGEVGSSFVDSSNRTWARFPADQTGEVQTGTSDIEILRGRLAEILFHRCEALSQDHEKEGGKRIEFIFGDYADEIEQDGEKVHVKFSKSGAKRSFDVVVGSDGLQSSTRRLVWGHEGEKDRIRRLGMYGGFFSIPKGETDTNWMRWYHAPGRRGIMLRPGETADKTTIFMHVINDRENHNDERFEEVAADGRKGVEAQKALLAEYFDDAGWESKRIIRDMYESEDFYYDMVAHVRLNKWSKGRVVLVGDAA